MCRVGKGRFLAVPTAAFHGGQRPKKRAFAHPTLSNYSQVLIYTTISGAVTFFLIVIFGESFW